MKKNDNMSREKNDSLSISGIEMYGEMKSRVVALETEMKSNREDFRDIKDNISLIRENHLAHIQKAIEEINIKMAKLDPQNKLINKIIDYIVMAVVIAIVSLVITNK